MQDRMIWRQVMVTERDRVLMSAEQGRARNNLNGCARKGPMSDSSHGAVSVSEQQSYNREDSNVLI